MAQAIRPWLGVCVLLAVTTAPQAGRVHAGPDEAQPAQPLPAPTQQELDHREAMRLYGDSLLQERESRLIEAVTSLERAVKLDPDSALLHKTLVSLYLALDRVDDALTTARRALDLDPGDQETWYLYAGQLKAQNRTQEAIAALLHAGACEGIQSHPELRLQVAFDLGGLYESTQDFDKAAAAFGEVVALLEKPDVLAEQGAFNREELAAQAAETYERLGRVCVRARHFDRAIEAYRKAQEKDPQRRQRLFFNLADVYRGEGKWQEALGCLDEYLKSQPEGTEAYEQKISLLQQLGRGKEVLPALEQYAAQDAQNPALKLLLARQYGQEGQPQLAEEIYRTLAQQTVNSEVYRAWFGLLRERNRAGEILNLLDEALAQAAGGEAPPSTAEAAKARSMLLVLRDNPELVKALLGAVRLCLQRGRSLQPDTRRFLALLAARARQLEDAETLYRSCLRQGPPQALRANENELYGGLLRVLWQAHKYEAVADLCREGLAHAQATNRLLFHLDLARALMLLGKTDEAVAEANAAVDIAGQARLDALRVRATILAEAGHQEEALADCDTMRTEFTQGEELHEVRYALSQVYAAVKKQDAAEEQLQAIIKEHPDDATARNDLGYQWAEQGKNLEEAEKLIREALELDRKARQSGTRVEADSDEDNAAYVDSLGWVLFRRERLEEAREQLQKAVTLPDGADDPVVWDHLGDVCQRLKQTEQAQQAWHKAVELYEGSGRRRPDDRYKDIQQKLKLLESTPAPH